MSDKLRIDLPRGVGIHAQFRGTAKDGVWTYRWRDPSTGKLRELKAKGLRSDVEFAPRTDWYELNVEDLRL